MDFIETVNSDGSRGSVKLPSSVKNYLIDIDGTICEDIPNDEPERMAGAKIIEGSQEKINKWYESGNVVTFFTSRTDAHREVTEKWLNEHGFKYNAILFNKPKGGNYYWIDDRDISCNKFTAWNVL